MSWLYSRALVEAFSEEHSLDGEPSAPSRSTPTAPAYWSHGKTSGFSRLSRFGMTLAPLGENRGEELLTWYLAGFPARTSVAPGRETGLRGNAADSGKSSPGSLARFDRSSSSWRT